MIQALIIADDLTGALDTAVHFAAAGFHTQVRVTADAAPDESAPVDADKTIAFPLKNKYADYSRGENEPIYRFELDTPNGVKELTVSAEQYETYYIGDEIICRERGRELEIV